VVLLQQQLGVKTLSEIESAIPFAVTRMLDETALRDGAQTGAGTWDAEPLRTGSTS
jgi:hypothetical protein